MITDEVLKQLEEYAEKKKDFRTLIVCQCLKEIGEIKKELQDIRSILESNEYEDLKEFMRRFISNP